MFYFNLMYCSEVCKTQHLLPLGVNGCSSTVQSALHSHDVEGAPANWGTESAYMMERQISLKLVLGMI